MSSRRPACSTKIARTTIRRLLKLASLGIAGLVAGSLIGCTADTVTRFSTRLANESLTTTRRIENLDYHRTPEIRRAPTLHRNQPVPRQQRRNAYAIAGEIAPISHHYTSRYPGQ